MAAPETSSSSSRASMLPAQVLEAADKYLEEIFMSRYQDEDALKVFWEQVPKIYADFVKSTLSTALSTIQCGGSNLDDFMGKLEASLRKCTSMTEVHRAFWRYYCKLPFEVVVNNGLGRVMSDYLRAMTPVWELSKKLQSAKELIVILKKRLDSVACLRLNHLLRKFRDILQCNLMDRIAEIQVQYHRNSVLLYVLSPDSPLIHQTSCRLAELEGQMRMSLELLKKSDEMVSKISASNKTGHANVLACSQSIQKILGELNTNASDAVEAAYDVLETFGKVKVQVRKTFRKAWRIMAPNKLNFDQSDFSVEKQMQMNV